MAEDSRPYVEANERLWDELVDIHVASRFYDVDGFKAGGTALGALERTEVGPVEGKRLLHLLCHFGLDTLSWARLGARVTGVDISRKAIAAAQALAATCGLEARFLRGEVFEAADLLSNERFDVIFLSWGAVCWISDFPRLARMAAALLAPGGIFYLLDGHPLCQALDDGWTPEAGPPRLVYDYESGAEPSAYLWGPDYADRSARPKNEQAYEWAHGLGRIVSALADAGLAIEFLHEHETVAWQAQPGLVACGANAWTLPPGQPRLALSFSVRARKPG